MFEYKHFIVGTGLLERDLNQYGADGWRLHTCEPLAIVNDGVSILQFVVVMDRIVIDQSPAESEAMAIKG